MKLGLKGERMDIYQKRFTPDTYEALYNAEITNGYLTLPEECFKDMNSESLIITLSWVHGIVCIYTAESFDEVRRYISLLNTMDANARAMRRRIVGSAEELNRINGNTIHIDTEHLNDLGVDSSQEGSNKEPFPVVVLKCINRIEIVSTALYEKMK